MHGPKLQRDLGGNTIPVKSNAQGAFGLVAEHLVEAHNEISNRRKVELGRDSRVRVPGIAGSQRRESRSRGDCWHRDGIYRPASSLVRCVLQRKFFTTPPRTNRTTLKTTGNCTKANPRGQTRKIGPKGLSVTTMSADTRLCIRRENHLLQRKHGHRYATSLI